MKTHRKALKPKDINRISELQLKHPGDLTEEEAVELKTLEDRRARYGKV